MVKREPIGSAVRAAQAGNRTQSPHGHAAPAGAARRPGIERLARLKIRLFAPSAADRLPV
jgi:hypothetical protein